MSEIMVLSNTVTHITVSNNCGNDESLTVLDMSRFPYLREFVVGNECFKYVDELKLIGLNRLTKVVIGGNSFTKYKNSHGNDPLRHFYLKSCPKMKSLKTGHYSFLDYSICEIESVDALETIQIGEVGKDSMNFVFCCAFQLRSCFSLNLMICRYVISQDCYHWTRIDARALLRCL